MWHLLELLTRTVLLAFWDYRAEGVENVPKTGGAIVASSHQSHLDPLMVRAPVNRTLGYVARSTLFGNRLFAWLIRSLGAVSFDRERSGAREMRGIAEALDGGAALIVFPEGTRSRDGEVGDLRPGIALLARRASVPVVPAAVEGTFKCWPRHRRIFRPGRVRVVFGEPVEYGPDMGREDILADLKERMVALQRRARSIA